MLKEVGLGEFITNAELLSLECDILIPAALENAIDASECCRRAGIPIVEAANHPVSPEADAALAEGGVIVIPDILANAGGVTGSYFEWTSNLTEFRWSEEQFNKQLLEFLDRAFRAMWDRHLERRSIYGPPPTWSGSIGSPRLSDYAAWLDQARRQDEASERSRADRHDSLTKGPA